MIIIFDEYRSLYEWVHRKYRAWSNRAADKALTNPDKYRHWQQLLAGIALESDFHKLANDPNAEEDFLDCLSLRWLSKFQSEAIDSYEIVRRWNHQILPIYTQIYQDRLANRAKPRGLDNSPAPANTLLVQITRQTSRLLRLLLLDRLIRSAIGIWQNLSMTENDGFAGILEAVVELRLLLNVLKIRPQSLVQFLRSDTMTLLQLHTLRDEFYALLGLAPRQRHELLTQSANASRQGAVLATEIATHGSDFVTRYDGAEDVDFCGDVRRPTGASRLIVEDLVIEDNHPLRCYEETSTRLGKLSISANGGASAAALGDSNLDCDALVIEQLLEMFSTIGDRSRKISEVCDRTSQFLGRYGYRLCKRIEILISTRRFGNKHTLRTCDLVELKMLQDNWETIKENAVPSTHVGTENSERVVGVFVSLFGSKTNKFLMNMASLITDRLLEKARSFSENAIIHDKKAASSSSFFVQCRELLDVIGCKTTIKELPEYAVCEQLLADEVKGWWNIGDQFQTLVMSRFPWRANQVASTDDLNDGITDEDVACMAWLERPSNPLRRRLRELKAMYDRHNNQRSLMFDASLSKVRLKIQSARDNIACTRVFETDVLKAEIILLINSESDPENKAPLTTKAIAEKLAIDQDVLSAELKMLQTEGIVTMDGHAHVKLAVF